MDAFVHFFYCNYITITIGHTRTFYEKSEKRKLCENWPNCAVKLCATFHLAFVYPVWYNILRKRGNPEQRKVTKTMTCGLVKGRKTIFVNGYAVQWFSQLLRTKVIIYVNVPNNKYVCISEMTLPYIADDSTVENVARGKIEELESL